DRLVKMGNLVDVLCDFFRMARNGSERVLLTFATGKHLEHNKEIEFGYLDLRGSSLLPAYNGHLGVTVRQHFYSRHRVELRHPYLPCVAVNGANGQNNFYPLEVIEAVKN
ncbi:hypothetical protein AAVH_36262, partial [Aphelenchoides avenae]